MLMTVGAAAADRGGTTRSVYLVALSDPPLAVQAAARVRSPGLDAQQQHRAVRRELDSAASQAWLQHLDEARASVVSRAQQRIGRPLSASQVYRYASNGMALELDADEAAHVAALPGVVAVRRERVLHISTDAGPQWIGANQLWVGVNGVAATRGEGVVIGVIDTGINPTHPSFAASSGDGFTITNPRGHFYGLCATGQAQCNGKLIGIYDFTNEGSKGVDTVGHGSHVSGIAAGNAINDALQGYTVSLSRNVSGVAPHANLIMYKGCNSKPIDSSSDGTCAESALVAAIDQATADQVDVINYSIGGGAADPYELLADHTSDAYAFFNARAAGVVISVSAGNDGPGAGTVDEPGNVPWVIGVANASHNRRFVNSVGNFSGAPNAPATLTGQGYTSGYGPANIVYAGNYGNALCGIGDTQGVTPTGASNPFAAGTFHGEIVICDRGIYARVEKGYNVKAAGAGGYILANAASDGESIISDDHFLPAVHLGYSEGQTLKAWVASGGTHGGSIAGVSAALDASFGDILDSTSSRGPYGFSGGVLKPDLTAPGDNILSAAQTGSGLALLSGTSMASPHVAGSAALVIAAHPDWSPAQVESALIGTALANSVRMQDAITLASPLDAGSGRVEPALAAQAGLFLPLDSVDFFAGSGSLANPLQHGDLTTLNRIGIESENCFVHCSFSRSVTDMSNGGTWQVAATATTGAVLKVTPSQFTLGAGASQNLDIALDVSDPHLPGNWVSGRIVLHKTGGGRGATDIALTVAAYASPGAMQPFQQLNANAPGGYIDIPVGGLVALPNATFATTTLAPAGVTHMTLGVDTKSSGQVYNPGTGKQFVLFPMRATSNIPEFLDTVGRVFIVEISASNAVQAVLYAGMDSNNDGTPEASEQACRTSYSSAQPVARCIVDLRGAPAGTQNVWALVDVPQGSPGATYNVTLSGAVPMIPASVTTTAAIFNNAPFVVTGPGHVAETTNFPIRLAWGGATTESQSQIASGTYYGAALIDALAGSQQGQIGFVPFAFVRAAGGNDVANAIEPGALRTFVIEPGETLNHLFIDVPANATSLQVITGESAGAPANNLTFYVVSDPFPAASSSPLVPAAPPPPPGTMPWSIGGSTSEKTESFSAGPGRWYLVATNNGNTEATFSVGAQLAYGSSAAPALTPGNYFNPQRSGHGIFMSQAGGQQVVDWYTFREDGTPTWYLAQGTAPAGAVGAWSADLYRASWNGSSGAPTRVGEVILTATAPDRAMFSWHLDGTSGSEAFELIAQPACVNVGGNVNLNGEWFPPAQAGYGFDALVLPGQQFDAFYMYDASGNPRWVVGANGPFAASSTIAMLQSTGFCPVCAYQALTTQPAGNMTVAYANGSSGQLSTAITLDAPLNGTWNIGQPIARLTGSSTCAP
jgi:subtilisin family serine protease